MWPYWLLFLIPAWLAINRARLYTPAGNVLPQLQQTTWPVLWRAMFCLLTLMIGLRYEVGGDWFNYVGHVDAAIHVDFWEALTQKDPAYGVLLWCGIQTGWDMYFVNCVCAMLFSFGLVVFCRSQSRPWLALVVSVPYLVIVVGMGYTRQGVAIGLAMVGLVALVRGSVMRFIIWVALAAMFHKSAVILVPLAVLAGSKRRWLTVVLVVVSGVLLFGLLLQESVDSLKSGYIDAAYDSSGAAVRVAMNALPGALFLLFRKRFKLPEIQDSFWGWMSWVAILFVLLLAVSPSSTAVDRVALYWIPIQLFIWARLPEVFGSALEANSFWVIAVVGYSAAVMFVWLVFGTHAQYWLPYQFYPWVWFWQ
jgi:EpsG family